MPDSSIPTFVYELDARTAGYVHVAGIDEAGRGALAGPVAAAAVIVPPMAAPQGVWQQVRDSKLLTPAVRATLFDALCAAAVAWAVALVDAATIDRCGIAAATRQAMTTAIHALDPAPDFLLIDWVRLPLLATPQRSFPKADRLSVSVAAASILAKVARDRHMQKLDTRYPGYGFAAHKGYGAPAHLAALAEFGPCPVHRHTFSPIARRPTLFEAP